MLVVRYFGYVGGVLLALLFACNALLPKEPLPSVLKSASDLPAIRIHSEKKWPARVVFDTTMRPIVPVAVAQADSPPAPPSVAVAQVAPPASPVAAKARAREAFAQFTPAETKARVAKPVHRRRIARARVSRPVMLAAQQPRFGWFDTW